MNAKIGLEIHVQLTEAGSKLFCSCKSQYRGMPPNTNVCPICLGLPGAIPVPSRRAILLSLAAAMSFNCSIPDAIVFTRKHYFYPDLPKNYQITQYERVGGAPVCSGGWVEYLDPEGWEWRRVALRRINLEEDPGRTTYGEGGILGSRYAFVDYNRSGVPLLEIVTEPVIRSPREARLVVESILLVLEYIGAVNPRLEGAFRVDANISVEGGDRVEVKNIGSTVDVEKALSYEYLRQKRIVEAGGVVKRETRHWDSARGVTKPLRYKEEEEEYLYFPDPDLPPVYLSKDLVSDAEKLVEATPRRVLDEIMSRGIKVNVAWSLVSSKPAAMLFLASVRMGADPWIIARMLGIDLKGEIREAGRDPGDPGNWPPPRTIVKLANIVSSGEYSYDTVKGLILPKLARNPGLSIEEVLPGKVDDISRLVEEVIREEAKAVNDYMSGKGKALNYLVGAVIRRAKGRAVDPRTVREMLLKRLEELRAS